MYFNILLHDSTLLWLYGIFYNLSVSMTFMISSITPRNTALRFLFCVPTVLHLYEFKISNFFKNFSVNSINFEFASKKKVDFNHFL